jgi:hypothetical protein
MITDHRTLHRRVSSLVTEILTGQNKALTTISIPQRTLSRVVSGREDYLLTTLVDVADALGCDVVINLRVRA